MELQYRKATLDDAHRVFHIVRHTKNVIYHDYYTQEVVEYVDRYYTFEIIKSDIEQGRTCVLVKDGKIIGTGSRVDNHIMRVYVLPEFQGQGLGSAIMDELEEEIFESYNECVLEASLPACIFYENRDYKTVKHVKENIGDGKCMVYEIMRKTRYSSIIGFVVTVTVDRPIGSVHPKHNDLFYPINYGYIVGVKAPDDEWQDAYILGVDEPVKSFTGKVIAVIHRFDDVEDKWVVCPENMSFSKKEIAEKTDFQERFFKTEIII